MNACTMVIYHVSEKSQKPKRHSNAISVESMGEPGTLTPVLEWRVVLGCEEERDRPQGRGLHTEWELTQEKGPQPHPPAGPPDTHIEQTLGVAAG